MGRNLNRLDRLLLVFWLAFPSCFLLWRCLVFREGPILLIFSFLRRPSFISHLGLNILLLERGLRGLGGLHRLSFIVNLFCRYLRLHLLLCLEWGWLYLNRIYRCFLIGLLHLFYFVLHLYLLRRWLMLD
jgi:hypothetical protein